MKIYTVLGTKNGKIVTMPAVTACKETAISTAKVWNKNEDSDITYGIIQYEVKTQGKNFGCLASPQKFNESE